MKCATNTLFVASAFTPGLSALGGAILGVTVAGLFLLTGRLTGVSGILEGVVRLKRAGVSHKPAFIAGLIHGGALLHAVWPASVNASSGARPPGTELSWAGYVLGGVLVGFGTRYGNGCTSGHGICGLARLAPRSIANVSVFMATAIASATAVQGNGWFGTASAAQWDAASRAGCGAAIAAGGILLVVSLVVREPADVGGNQCGDKGGCDNKEGKDGAAVRKRRQRFDAAVSYLGGAAFAAGLAVSGMGQRSKARRRVLYGLTIWQHSPDPCDPHSHCRDAAFYWRVCFLYTGVTGIILCNILPVYTIPACQVVGFLSLAPAGPEAAGPSTGWDPSLAFVLAAATGLCLVAFPQIQARRPAPVLGDRFRVPTNNKLDLPLILGGWVFGLGWGITGVCPAPALLLAGAGFPKVALGFMPALMIGMYAASAAKAPPCGGAAAKCPVGAKGTWPTSRTRVLMDDGNEEQKPGAGAVFLEGTLSADELVASPYLRNTQNRDAPLRSEGVVGWLSLVTDGSRLAVDKTVPSCEEAVRAAGIAWAHVPVDPANVDAATAAAVVRALDGLPRPCVIQCASGVRAYTAWLAYCMHRGLCTPSEAETLATNKKLKVLSSKLGASVTWARLAGNGGEGKDDSAAMV